MARARDVLTYQRVARAVERQDSVERMALIRGWAQRFRTVDQDGEVDVSLVCTVPDATGYFGNFWEVEACHSRQHGRLAYDVFLSSPFESVTTTGRSAYFCGTIGFGGEVNGMPMSGEWFRLPDSIMEARFNATMVGPVTCAFIDDEPGELPTSVLRCDGGGVVVPFLGIGSVEWPQRSWADQYKLCPLGSVMDMSGRLLDGEWMRMRLRRSGRPPCAYGYDGGPRARGAPSGPAWSAGGSKVALASAAALAATALAVARKGRR